MISTVCVILSLAVASASRQMDPADHREIHATHDIASSPSRAGFVYQDSSTGRLKFISAGNKGYTTGKYCVSHSADNHENVADEIYNLARLQVS